MKRAAIVVLSTTLLAAGPAPARDPSPPAGLLAASVEQTVVLADPATGESVAFETGPVGWLFEAPGGVLFAPDLVDGRTTVIDLRTRGVADRFEGVTMPHFGPSADRYAVVAGDVLLVTYPERAVIARLAAGIDRPWQVEMFSESALIALERGEDAGGAVLSAVDMVTRQVVYRRPLPGDVRRFALSRSLGLLALADPSSSSVPLVAPATLTGVASLPMGGAVRDVAALEGERPGIVAVASVGEGGGELKVWQIKAAKGELKIKKEQHVALAGPPVRLAVSPDGQHAAVAVASGDVIVVSLDRLETLRVLSLGHAPRDLVWCDPARPGPLLPDWSDDDPPELRLGPK